MGTIKKSSTFLIACSAMVMAQSSFAKEASGPTAATVPATRTVTPPGVILQTLEKNHQAIYSKTLVPLFGPSMGATAAGTVPSTTKVPEQLTSTALGHTILNVAELVVGAGLGGVIGYSLYSKPETVCMAPNSCTATESALPEATLIAVGAGAGAGVGLIFALITNAIWPANEFAEYAAAYNRALHKKFRWQDPKVVIDPKNSSSVSASWGVRF